MELGRITFVKVEAIARMESFEKRHFAVPGDFRQNRRRRNRRNQCITFDDRFPRYIDRRIAISIDDKPIGRDGKRIDGSCHCQQSRLENVDPVDFARFGSPDGPTQGILLDRLSQRFALFCRDFLRIHQAFDRLGRVQHDSRRENRAGQTPAANLVDACNRSRVYRSIPRVTFRKKLTIIDNSSLSPAMPSISSIASSSFKFILYKIL